MSNALRKTFLRTMMQRVVKPMGQPRFSLATQRRLLDTAAISMRTPRGMTAESTTLGQVPARKLTPRLHDSNRHVLYLHGGAYVQGSIASHTALAGQMATAARATVWLAGYRLAPENPYPAAVEDALCAYRALLDSGIPAQRIALAGDSAGGGLTLATALALRDAQLPLPAALVMLSPWTDLTLSGASLRDKAEAEVMLNADFLELSAGRYCGSESPGKSTLRTDPGVSPLFADLAGLPPMLVHVGSDEILLDDSTCLADRAKLAGVDIDLRVFEGLWHVFQAQAGLIDEADESLQEIAGFLRKHMPDS